MENADPVAAGETVPDANPVESVADDATPETEATKPEASPEAPDPSKEKDGLLKKVNKLTWQRREAERERDLLRQRIESLERQSEATVPKAVPEKPKTLADFEFDEGRYAQHIAEQTRKDAINAARDVLKQEQEKEAKGKAMASFRKREEAFAESVDDYLEVTRSQDLPISPHMAEVIAESDDGPALAYYLGKNLEIAERIASLPFGAAARELGRIEERLAAERAKAKEKAVSKAPPPTPKLDASEAEVEKDPEKMSMNDWLKWREKQLKRNR